MLKLPKPNSHKGDNGKVLIIAGSKAYHGSALLAIKAAIPFVDLVYFYSLNDPYLMQAVKNIPEVIVVDYYPKVDSALLGPGLADREVNIPNCKLVVDADGLKKVDKFNKSMLLTPHQKEFRDLFNIEPTKENVLRMAKKHNTNILLKGPVDYLSDGSTVFENAFGNAGLTKGGTGDALAGFLTALIAKNNIFEAAKVGVEVFCKAADKLFEEKGFYYTPSDIINILPNTLKEVML